jgi:rRNA-processing protein FCF1
MTDPAKQLLTYSRLGVVIDSNLLLLLFLGGYDRRQIATNDRLSKFNEEDYNLLIRVLEPFERIVTTPNILTEVSNLSNAIPESKKADYFAAFASRVVLLDEQHVLSATALTSRWAKFGLTDAVIATIAKNQYLVLTDDFRLSQSLQSDGIDALNFNHLREAYWQLNN